MIELKLAAAAGVLAVHAAGACGFWAVSAVYDRWRAKSAPNRRKSRWT